MAELLYESPWENFYSLVIDLLIFLIKSIYYIAESIYLTLLPNRLRKIKVSTLENLEKKYIEF